MVVQHKNIRFAGKTEFTHSARYRLFDADGAEQGEATSAVLVKPDETIWTGDGRKLCVASTSCRYQKIPKAGL